MSNVYKYGEDHIATTVREGLEKAVKLLAHTRGSEIPRREPKSKILAELRAVLLGRPMVWR